MFTQRPAATVQRGELEALVYVRQSCTTHALPESGVVRFGRGQGSDIRIDDQSVSRFHFALHMGGELEVEDLGSANGTMVFATVEDEDDETTTKRSEEETRLSPNVRRRLVPGDLVRAGIALIVVQVRRPRTSRAPRTLSTRPSADSGPTILLDPDMKRAYETARRAARSGISVLITGETGSGKELFAETIHSHSSRRDRPFLRLNCAALSETLLESELFGHERGAFTGASQTKVGLLESTDHGTVLLDEIGEMPLSIQAKLLRVLEERSILRVGATKPRPIDVRFIWATNRDLRAEARLGRFRNDLYYRIAGVEFSIPPLRRRPIEIEPLARLFLDRFCKRSGIATPSIEPEAIAAMQRYSWPGNVRELKNVMERAPFLCEGGPITLEHVPSDQRADEFGLFPAEENEVTDVFVPSGAFPPPRSIPAFARSAPPAPLRSVAPPPPLPSSSGLRRDIDSTEERERILEALEECAGNQTRAAKLLGISRRTLINRLERLNLPRPQKV